MGGFHAKIRLDKTGLEEVMVLQWPRKMTDSGEKNTDVCAMNNMVITGSVFPRERIHKQHGCPQI